MSKTIDAVLDRLEQATRLRYEAVANAAVVAEEKWEALKTAENHRIALGKVQAELGKAQGDLNAARNERDRSLEMFAKLRKEQDEAEPKLKAFYEAAGALLNLVAKKPGNTAVSAASGKLRDAMHEAYLLVDKIPF